MADPASLQNLKDIIEPAAVRFWPPAPGVWLVVALVLIWAAAGVALGGCRWRQNAYRRAGLRELGRIRRHLSRPEGTKAAVAALSALLKRVALTAFPREKVAALSGDRWLAFLDASMPGGGFCSPPGNLLAESPYRPVDYSLNVSDLQVDDLFHLAEVWIQRHKTTKAIDSQPEARNTCSPQTPGKGR